MVISKRTTMKMAKLFELRYTKDRIGVFLEGEGVPRDILNKYSDKGKEIFSSRVMFDLHENGSNDILMKIAEDLLLKKGTSPSYFVDESDYYVKSSELLLSLENDGLKFTEDKLVPIVDEDFEAEENLFKQNLSFLELNDAITYLDQSYENFISKNWESANSMTRTTLEYITTEIAKKISLNECDNHSFNGHKSVRSYLRNKLLDDDEFKILTDFMHWCSGNGSHPGISNENECRLRRIITIGFCQYYIEKYQKKFF
jgi:hypothetical protein